MIPKCFVRSDQNLSRGKDRLSQEIGSVQSEPFFMRSCDPTRLRDRVLLEKALFGGDYLTHEECTKLCNSITKQRKNFLKCLLGI